MNYDQMAAIGACGPGVGCPPPYPGVYPYQTPYYGAPFLGDNAFRTEISGVPGAYDDQMGRSLERYEIVGRVPQHWDIVGQEAPPAEGGWLQQPGPLGVTRLWWLLGSAAIGATWFAYSRGMLGGARRDFDGIGGDFFF